VVAASAAELIRRRSRTRKAAARMTRVADIPVIATAIR
jgi:hypothetical protein